MARHCRHSICNTDIGEFGRGLIGLTAIVVILADICLYGLGQEWCFIAWLLLGIWWLAGALFPPTLWWLFVFLATCRTGFRAATQNGTNVAILKPFQEVINDRLRGVLLTGGFGAVSGQSGFGRWVSDSCL